ncbi:MAG: hypothetical protein WCA48_17390, partial [Pseudomonas gingeri]
RTRSRKLGYGQTRSRGDFTNNHFNAEDRREAETSQVSLEIRGDLNIDKSSQTEKAGQSREREDGISFEDIDSLDFQEERAVWRSCSASRRGAGRDQSK